MDNREENKTNAAEEEQTAIDALISNAAEEEPQSAEEAPAKKERRKAKAKEEEEAADDRKIFRKYKIKDIVFLAIMAACMLVTGAIMPLVTQIPLFGIIELCLGLQFSIFPAIGLMKVRKPGALLLMSAFSGIVLAFMFLPMCICLVVCALIAEALVLLIFRGYKRDIACAFGAALYMPLTLPFLYIFYRFVYTWEADGGEKEAIKAYIGSDAGVAVGLSFAVIAVCVVGAIIGVIISRELKKAGILKK